MGNVEGLCFLIFIDLFLEREREKNIIVALIYAFIGHFLYALLEVCALTRGQIFNLSYWDNALTSRAVQPGQKSFVPYSNLNSIGLSLKCGKANHT